MHERLAFHLHRRVVSGRHRAGLARQERGEVARDAGVLGVGQAICARPVRRAICGRSVMADFGKIHRSARGSVHRGSTRLDRAAHQRGTSARDDERRFLSFPSANMFSLAWRQAKVRALIARRRASCLRRRAVD